MSAKEKYFDTNSDMNYLIDMGYSLRVTPDLYAASVAFSQLNSSANKDNYIFKLNSSIRLANFLPASQASCMVGPSHQSPKR